MINCGIGHVDQMQLKPKNGYVSTCHAVGIGGGKGDGEPVAQTADESLAIAGDLFQLREVNRKAHVNERR
jgi:hypothetical protein